MNERAEHVVGVVESVDLPADGRQGVRQLVNRCRTA
jgi:hypothetical protein